MTVSIDDKLQHIQDLLDFDSCSHLPQPPRAIRRQYRNTPRVAAVRFAEELGLLTHDEGSQLLELNRLTDRAAETMLRQFKIEHVSRPTGLV